MLVVVAAIDDLKAKRAGDLLREVATPLFNAKSQLESLFVQSVYSPYLRISREKGDALHGYINQILADVADPEKRLDDGSVWTLHSHRHQFTIVFLSELSTLPSFLVLGKECYETNVLIDDGAKLFPPSLAQKAHEAIPDAREAGRALAFEMPTACGFHVFRVIEAVLKRYWDHSSDNADRPHLETIGSYASELGKGGHGDAKVIESLKQIAKLHRNPLIHPEVILSNEEAIETLGIARSVVGAMLRFLPDIPPTTSTAANP